LAPLNPEISGGGPRPPLEVQPDGRKWIPNSQIVPGSETVIGPDMMPGPHYGQPIAYTRVERNYIDPTAGIGPNEYAINYADILPNPNPGSPLPMLQAAGTIIFDSGSKHPGQPQDNQLPTASYQNGVLTGPAANIVVTYQIQNNLA